MRTETDQPMTADTQTLQQAIKAHGDGRLDEAQALYQHVLAHSPQHPDALHLLGVLHAQRGRLQRAAESIAAAIESNPREAMFHNNYGNVCFELGRSDEAEASYMRAIELDPGRLDALNNLGVLLGRRGDGDGAEKLLHKVIELAPDFADARQNLANHYVRMGRLSDAVQQCCDGLVVAPRNAALRRILGIAYSMLGMNEQAIAVWRAWLEAEPGNPLAEFHLSACTGEGIPLRAPDDYVERIFDSFARSFDAKLAELSYRAPEIVAEAVARHAGPGLRKLDQLDAGCGTGLCGPLLAPWARRLAGVDLSDGMLRQAAARACYDELVKGELVAFLRSRTQAWDLVVSADTLCYFGDLGDFATAAATALRPTGLLVFTVEAHPDDDAQPAYRLQHHGRYSHRRSYVESALKAGGLQPLEVSAAVLRMEAGQPVQGWLVVAGHRSDP